MSEMLEKILSNENIEKAYKRVYANKGAGGVGITVVRLISSLTVLRGGLRAQLKLQYPIPKLSRWKEYPLRESFFIFFSARGINSSGLM